MLRHQDLNSCKHVPAIREDAPISCVCLQTVFLSLFQLEVTRGPSQKESSAHTVQVVKWENPEQKHVLMSPK